MYARRREMDAMDGFSPAHAQHTAAGRSVAARRLALRWFVLLLALTATLAVALAPAGCTRQRPNSVAAFLDGAERQTETPAHREEVRRALADMLRLAPGELAQRRYRDYDGTPGSWTALDVLERSFVPENAAVLDSATFYRDVAGPAARQAIQRQLSAVEQALADQPPASGVLPPDDSAPDDRPPAGRVP
jgi:hypothetical protein